MATPHDPTELVVEAIWRRVEENVAHGAGTDCVLAEAWSLVRALPSVEPASRARLVAVAVELLERLPRSAQHGVFRDEFARRTSDHGSPAAR